MRIFSRIIKSILLLFLTLVKLNAQPGIKLQEKFEEPGHSMEKTGRGLCTIANGVLKTKDSYASFGENDWANYEVQFSARTPVPEAQVQIWAGFRAHDRDNHYMLGLRGSGLPGKSSGAP